jgi:hypothetical protein
MKKLSDREIYERSISEEDVVGQIRSMLEVNGARVFRVVERIPWGRKKSEAGIPDLFLWFPARTVEVNDNSSMAKNKRPIIAFIEVKRKGGKLRPHQAMFIDRANEDGVIAFKAESWDECAAEFRRYGIQLRVGG